MGKTAQRKVSLYQMGFEDAKIGFFRWKRHPFLSSYKKGWRDARLHFWKRTQKSKKSQKWYKQLLSKLMFYGV